MKIPAFRLMVLREYVVRAKATGTFADAAIAADYMAKITGKSYASCMDAIARKFAIRYAERECKDRPGMYVEKNPARELAAGCPVKFDKETLSETNVPTPTADFSFLGL